MSKSSGNNNDINIAYLEKLTESVTDVSLVLQKISESYGANGQLEQALKSLAKAVNDGSMSTKQMLKEAAATQKNIRSVEYGLSDTTKYTKTVNMFTKLLEEKLGNSKIDDVLVKKIATAFENLDVTAILESEKIGARGGKGAPLKNVMENEKLGRVNEDLAKKLGVKLDSVQYKILTFFEGAQQKTSNVIRELGVNLLEGLEKSKWVGGALRDTFRLVGLLGANFLSQFGQLGRILGGAFYIAMETAGPFLVKLLLDGMGKLFSGLISGKILGGLVNKLPMNGPLGNAITTVYGGGTGAQKAAALKGLVGPGIAATAAFAGGGWALGQAADSLSQGRKGNAAALGLGGTALIGGGIAALVAGFTAPITVPLLAIGASVTAIAATWKHFGGDIQNHFKKNKEFYDKVLDILGIICPVFGLLRNFINWWQDKNGYFEDYADVEDAYGNKNSGTQKVANYLGFQDKEAVQNISGFGINRAGGVIGLEKVDRMAASKIAEDYFRLYPEQAGSIYERVGSEYASLGDFQNDWAIRDAQGNAKEAILHQGATEELRDLWTFMSKRNKEAAEQGKSSISSDVIKSLKYTSGRSTKGSPHVKPKVGDINTHSNIAAMVTDLGAANWTDDEWKTALPWIQEYMEGLGYRVRYEGNRAGGGTYIGKGFQAGLTNRHLHVDMLPGRENAISMNAKANIDASKVRAVARTEELMKIAKDLEPERYNDWMNPEKHKNLNQQQREAHLKSEMETAGYEFDDTAKHWTKKVKKGQKDAVIIDASGNYKFERMLNTMENLGAGSTNGRIGG